MGHSGNGTTNHVAILRLQLNEKVKFNIMPYRGSGPGINDLLAGNIDCFADQLTSSMPHIQSRQAARPLVNFGLDHIPDLPNVPTLKEAGCTPFEGGTTAGVFVRKETPQAAGRSPEQGASSSGSRTRPPPSACASSARSCGRRRPSSSPRRSRPTRPTSPSC